jgi:hypothetical protein
MIKKDWSKYLIIFLLFWSFALVAQPSKKSTRPPGSSAFNMETDPDGPPPPNPVPITGIEFLLGAGALLGVRKYVQGREKEAGSQ